MRNPCRIVYSVNVIRNVLPGLTAIILGDLAYDPTPVQNSAQSNPTNQNYD